MFVKIKNNWVSPNILHQTSLLLSNFRSCLHMSNAFKSWLTFALCETYFLVISVQFYPYTHRNTSNWNSWSCLVARYTYLYSKSQYAVICFWNCCQKLRCFHGIVDDIWLVKLSSNGCAIVLAKIGLPDFLSKIIFTFIANLRSTNIYSIQT